MENDVQGENRTDGINSEFDIAEETVVQTGFLETALNETERTNYENEQ